MKERAKKPLRAPRSWGPLQRSIDFDAGRRERAGARSRRAFELARRAMARGKRELGERLWRAGIVAQSESMEFDR